MSDFKLMLSQMCKSELLELVNHPNFQDRKEIIENELQRFDGNKGFIMPQSYLNALENLKN